MQIMIDRLLSFRFMEREYGGDDGRVVCERGLVVNVQGSAWEQPEAVRARPRPLAE